MVYPGPWQDSRIHEELLTLKTSAAGSNTVELLGEFPTVRSGWDASNLSALGWRVLSGRSLVYEQGIDNPPDPNPGLSAEAFEGAFDEMVGSGDALQHLMRHMGEQRFTTPPPEWIQDQQWDVQGGGYRLWFNPALNTRTGTGIYAIPAGMDNATSDYYIELETLASPKPVELVEVTVLASPGTYYHLYVKDAETAPSPFLRSAVAQGGTASTITQAKGFPSADSDLPLNHGLLTSLARSGTPYGGAWSLDGRMPTMSILYNGPTLDTSTLGGVETDFAHDGQPVRIRIRYRWPRWRQVFYEPPVDPVVPYRRVFPRDDTLGAGGRRNYPRSKSLQTGNRIGGGYL